MDKYIIEITELTFPKEILFQAISIAGYMTKALLCIYKITAKGKNQPIWTLTLPTQRSPDQMCRFFVR